MQTINRTRETLNGEPPDGGFWQIVDGVRREMAADAIGTLAAFSQRASNESLQAMNALERQTGDVALAGGPQPAVIKILG